MISLRARAFSKLNLYLDITGRRADGYHLIETVMHSISLHDLVTVRLSGGSGISVSCDREDVPTDSRNTAYRAAELFLQAAGISARADISIEKHIPSGAGLGGGSADAAAVLTLMNSGLGAPLNMDGIMKIAAQVGADVPFCVVGGMKLCRGIGEEITDLPELDGRLNVLHSKYFVVAKPDFSCPTGEAYGRYDSAPLPPYGGLERFRAALPGDFAPEMYNVFQRLYADERIESLCGRLTELGAEGALLTGSGSAVFGVFSGHERAEAAVKELRGCGFRRLCTGSRKGGTEFIGMEGTYL